jgi:sugar lactone lactonase YvrE
MRNRILLAILALATVMFAATGTTTRAQSEPITLKDATIRPEGIAYNAASGTWLVSSTAKGTIYEVAADGSVTPFIEDKDLKATLGLYIDAKTNLLYAVNSNFLAGFGAMAAGGAGGMPQLPPGVTPPAMPGGSGSGQSAGTPDAAMQQMIQQLMQGMDSTITLNVYDLKTKTRTQRVDLTKVASTQGIRFANDVTTDADGNAYVTDSFAAAIYRVDPKGTPAFLTDPQFAAASGAGGMAGMMGGGLSINGIAYHPDGVLLINKTTDGTLYKIALSDPSKVIPVKLSEPITGADGMRTLADGRIAVVSNQQNVLTILSSTDQWESATVAQQIEIPQGSTAVAVSDKELFVLSGSIGAGMMGGMGGGQPPAQPPANATMPAPTAATIKRIPIK